ncbi:NAD(P)/FAD-dependent oxidoreductase [Vannielia litorea]|uniref:NAD(P)/FAD-dependent oxidoreductase n=1 Tax=Vannielia litorea TaxID=1217970 RepID=UPI001C989247|nr:FAD-binding oxidoreductase [Vannielia litorea]MBY6046941.1 FAD-binding oxidoreductase [Vannielia litorea]MBY6074355.1 FAD-binding oxidoreductase [Vannielia litorea]
MQTDFDVAVIGGGIAGVSAAAEIANGASVVLIEAERQPGYHSSGRSAALFAPGYGSSAMQALTALSRPFFDAAPEGFSEVPLLTPRGLMRTASEDQLAMLEALPGHMRDPERLIWMSGEEAEARAPILRPGHVKRAFLDDGASDIDVHALLQGFLRQAKAAGAQMQMGTPVTALAREGDGWRVTLGKESLRVGVVVNAAGAWADDLAALAGVAKVGLQPKRRTAITVAAPEGIDVATLPMIVDAPEDFYVKPDAGRLLASPADETPSAPCDAQPEEMDVAICVDRLMTTCAVDVRRIESKWAGLRSFAPDHLPVVGFAPDAPGFFWLAGQGGTGVQTSPGAARLAATLVLGRPAEEAVGDTGLKAEAIAPGRPALAG